METRRLLQHGQQRPRAALRVLGGDAGVLGLHQGPGERPLHPATAFSGSQGRRQMVRLLYGWLFVVDAGCVVCCVSSFQVITLGLLLERLDFGPLTSRVVFIPLNPTGCLSSPVIPPTDKTRLSFLVRLFHPITLSSFDVFFFALADNNIRRLHNKNAPRCLCSSRWLQAQRAGKAPLVVLESTHEKAMEVVPLALLKEYSSEHASTAPSETEL